MSTAAGEAPTRGANALRESWSLAWAAAAVFALFWAWGQADEYTCVDYYQPWVVAHATQAGEGGAIYSDAGRVELARRYDELAFRSVGKARSERTASKRFQAAAQVRKIESYSTPWLYTFYGYTVGGDYDRDQLIFQRVSLLCLVGAVVWLCRVLGYSRAASGAALVVVLCWFTPVLSDVWVGNVNRLLLAVLVAVVALFGARPRAWRELLAGVLLGGTVVFKPNLGLIAVVWGVGWSLTGQWRKFALVTLGALVGAAGCFAAGTRFFGGTQIWFDWYEQALQLLGRRNPTLQIGNISAASLLRDGLGWEAGGVAVVAWVVPAALLALIVVAMLRTRSSWPGADAAAAAVAARRADVILLGVGAGLFAVATPLSWLHYHVLALPLALFVLRPDAPRAEQRGVGTDPGGSRRLLRRLALVPAVLVAFEPLQWLAGISPGGATAGACITAGTSLLLVLGVIDCALHPPGAGARVSLRSPPGSAPGPGAAAAPVAADPAPAPTRRP